MLYLALNHLRIGILNEMQYRVNFFIQLGQSLIAVATGLIGLWLVFSHTTDLNGWTRPELLIVMGIYLITGGVIQAAVQPNMQQLMEDIQGGTLDFALTKPADAQVLVSVRRFRLWQLTDVLVGFIVMFIGVYQYQGLLSIWEALAFIAALVMGSLLVYCFWLILTTTAFWIIRVNEMVNLFQGVYAAGRWPVDVYPGWLRAGLTFLVPVAFAVTIPAQALTDRLSPTSLLGALGLTLAFMLLARFVWRLGLKNYSGASA